MNLPSFVFPYHLPLLWYTPLAVFTQTIPGEGGDWVVPEPFTLAFVFPELCVLVLGGSADLEAAASDAGAAVVVAPCVAGVLPSVCGVDVATDFSFFPLRLFFSL